MKKVMFFLLALFLVPTVSLGASGLTIDDCIDYMNDYFETSENNNDQKIDNDEFYNNMPCH